MAQPHNQNILVLGAGELGSAVIRGLAQHRSPSANSTISVLLRQSSISSTDAEKKKLNSELESLNVRTVAGDVVGSSQGELAELFRPFDLIIGCVGMTAGSQIQTKITKAVLEAGVRRFLPWQFGVDYDAIGRGSAQDLFSEQLDVRDLLRGQHTTEWIIVSTGMFTSFLFEPAFNVVNVEEKEVRSLGGWENRVTVTVPEDIGKLTAEIVYEEPPIKNQVVYTAGDTVSYAQVADIVEAKLGSVKRIDQSVDFLKGELAKNPDDPMAKYRVVFGQGKGVSWDKETSFNGKKGIATVTVEQWVRENLR